MPYLQDQMFGHEAELKEFELARLREADGDENDFTDGAQPADGDEPVE